MASIQRPARETGIRHLGPGIEFNLISAIFEFLPDGLAFIDPNLVIRAANKVFAQQVRRPLASTVDHPVEEVIPGWTEQIGPIYRQVQETGRPFQGDAEPFVFREQPERGVTYWECTVFPVYEPDGGFEGHLLVHREVTERVRGDRECDDLRAEA